MYTFCSESDICYEVSVVRVSDKVGKRKKWGEYWTKDPEV